MIRFRVFAMLSLLSGCVSVVDPKDKLMPRVIEYSEALKRFDVETAYTFTSPGYRQLNSLLRYAEGQKSYTKREEFAVKGSECDGNMCKVFIMWTYRYAGLGSKASGIPSITKEFTQKWLYIDENWWILPR